MDHDEREPATSEVVAANIVMIGMAGAIVFSAYHIGKLGVDWTREGIRYRKAKKNQTKD